MIAKTDKLFGFETGFLFAVMNYHKNRLAWKPDDISDLFPRETPTYEIQQLAWLLGQSEDWVRDKIERGIFDSFKDGDQVRIPMDTVGGYLDLQRVLDEIKAEKFEREILDYLGIDASYMEVMRKAGLEQIEEQKRKRRERDRKRRAKHRKAKR